MNSIEQVIDEEGFFISTTCGYSMYPMLRDRQDNVVIKKQDTYHKYDIVLYKRNDIYILHRIIKVLDKGYIIRGDNCLYHEYDIDDDSKIIGCVVECYRGNKKINLNGLGYKLYVRIWNYSFPIRYLFKKIKGKIVGGLR